ncbi:MAG: ATP-binding protein [Solirubrobacteraceae bacterium]
MRELIEREATLERIVALLDDAQAGRGRCVLVEGEAGIGKTAVLATAGERARECGVRVLRARCGPLERGHVFGTVRQLLGPVLRDSGAAPRDGLFAGAAQLAAPLLHGEATPPAQEAGDGSDYATLHGLYWLLANLTERAPVLLAIDDVQWSDLPSLRFLDFLARRLDGLPVAVLVAIRSDAYEAEHPALGGLRANHEAERITPPPLSLAGVHLLVAEHLGGESDQALASACREATQGNPFYLHALLRDLALAGDESGIARAERVSALAPRDVTYMIARRLEPLPAAATALAEAVAVLGDGVSLPHAATLAQLDIDEATDVGESLARAGIFDSGGSLAFVHPIVRVAVSDRLGPRQRAERHGAAAVLLGDQGAEPSVVAAHLMLASPGMASAVSNAAGRRRSCAFAWCPGACRGISGARTQGAP